MKSRELFWMIVPCLALVLVGYRLSNPGTTRPLVSLALPTPTPTPTPGPFRLRVAKTEITYVTPRMVAEGYDRKVSVYISHSGRRPAWWGSEKWEKWAIDADLVYLKNGKLRRFAEDGQAHIYASGQPYHISYSSDPRIPNDTYVLEYFISLRDVPLHHGALFWKSDIVLTGKRYGFRHWSLPDAEYKKLKQQAVAFVPLTIPLRKKGERVLPPVVSTDSQLTAEQVQVSALSAQDRQILLTSSTVASIAASQKVPLTKQQKRSLARFDTKVVVTYNYRGKLRPDGSFFETGGGDVYLTDERGKRLDTPIEHLLTGTPPASRRYQETCYLQLHSVPRQRGQVTLHLRPHINEFWPLHAKFVVRKNGRIITGKQTPL